MRLMNLPSSRFLLSGLFCAIALPAFGADTSTPTAVNIPGSFQSHIGCPGDWQPECPASQLDFDAESDKWSGSFTLPAGNWEYKAALNNSWDENYGQGGQRNGANIALHLDAPREVTFIYDHESHQITDSINAMSRGDVTREKAYWLDASHFAWDISPVDGDVIQLLYSADGNLQITPEGIQADKSFTLQQTDLPQNTQQKFPHLSGLEAFTLGKHIDLEVLVTGQLALALYDSEGNLKDATGIQLAGLLDDRFYYDGNLGAEVGVNSVDFRLWAPTARSVKLHLFNNPQAETADRVIPMNRDGGTWHADAGREWDRAYYLYEVEVFSYFSDAVETNLVTDPYSLGLSINSGKSQIIDLDDRDLQPRGWKHLRKPKLRNPEDISLYELHVRDFSIEDKSVPENERGTFKAFTRRNSNGMRHLKKIARAGMTHVHLLPAFDFATVNEDRAQQEVTESLSLYAPDSSKQQAAVNAIRDTDGFNWGYDPLHFTVPEGSYATNASGPTRIREFREMVQGLSRNGLRVVMDVVYNHTSSYGQYDNSVLDKIVPGYYHRRNGEGSVEMSSCCANTASEHRMMERLMLDSMETWARDYKVDGFRFDLMGHHSLDNILKTRAMLDSLTPEKDGVDGESIYLYGEGWNFGEVADDARFVQARQSNMAGSGVGTFNDRLRDSVRGGNPFGGYEEQGFGNGLFTDPNGKFGGTDERATLLTLADKVRITLAGNLRNYVLTDSRGNEITGAELIYNGQPTGYTADPQESINYIAAHDNETLFDGVQIKASADASLEDRVRIQAFSNSLVLFAQGVPFIHAGQDFLRSKSMDRDSYNSGDWFNALDFTFESGNWGAGLPIADKNQDNWHIMQPLLTNSELAPQKKHRQWSAALFREQLAIRASSPLFRLTTAEEIQLHLDFLNTGPEQVPGLIAMQLRDETGDIDKRYRRVLVLFNGDDETVEFGSENLRGVRLKKHPLQRHSADERLREARFDHSSGTFTLPGRSTAVFVERRRSR